MPASSPSSSAGQTWDFNFSAYGYVPPHEDGYVCPILIADREWLHLEARYNYENLRTGSLWVGYTFTAGTKLVFSVTPMIGGVFGRSTGIAPGLEASLAYKKFQLSIENEYVFDTRNRSSSFYYDWPELIYSPTRWIHVGLVAQRTKAYQTSLDTQRGFLVGLSHRNIEFTTYVFDLGWTDPTVVLAAGFSF